jgi:ribonuclease HII
MDITLRHIKIGIDEAGRGPWYGPVVASALAFDPLFPPSKEFLLRVNDSKKLTEKKRDNLFTEIIDYARAGKIYFAV